MAKQSMRKFKRLLKGTAQGGAVKMTKSDWREVASTLGSDAGPGVRRKANPARQTKAAKREKTRKASVERRVAVALAKFLKQANPAMKTAGASIQRLKGGVIKITPIKANAAGGWKGWVIPGVKAGFRTKKAAERHIQETRMVGVKPVKYKGQAV